MENVAKHGNGTYDHDKRQWKVRTKEVKLSATIAQLCRAFKIDIPASEDGSRPYWRKYLQAYRNYLARQQGKRSPLQERIASLEGFIENFRLQGRDTTQLEAELAEARAMPEHGIEFGPRPTTPVVAASNGIDHAKELAEALADPVIGVQHADAPAIHPDMREHAALLDATGDLNDFTARFLNSIAPKPVPKAESLKVEVEAYIARKKAKAKPGSKGWMAVRQFLNLFLEQTGDIRTADITVQHYRDYYKAVTTRPGWGKRNWANAMQCVNSFLERMECDHDLRFGFRHNPDYKIGRTEGQKKQYSIEEVRTALQHATGINRLSLLMGLNTGAYWGDIETLKPEDIEDGYLTGPREKNSHKDVQVIGTWYLWPETEAALAYGYTHWQLQDGYKKFRDEHGLPEHKALRKTVAQIIQDDIGETEARLYRCEGVPGVHGNNYVKNFTEAQIARLEVALKYVRGVLLEGKPRKTAEPAEPAEAYSESPRKQIAVN